jgi:hypothetical protein
MNDNLKVLNTPQRSGAWVTPNRGCMLLGYLAKLRVDCLPNPPIRQRSVRCAEPCLSLRSRRPIEDASQTARMFKSVRLRRCTGMLETWDFRVCPQTLDVLWQECSRSTQRYQPPFSGQMGREAEIEVVASLLLHVFLK